jgi:hypothetical protein
MLSNKGFQVSFRSWTLCDAINRECRHSAKLSLADIPQTLKKTAPPPEHYPVRRALRHDMPPDKVDIKMLSLAEKYTAMQYFK